MGPPGLLTVRTRIIHPDLTDDAFNHWYNDILMPHVLEAAKASKVPGPPAVLRYQHAEGDKNPFPYLAMYPLPDIDWLKSEEWKAVPRSSDVLPGSGHMKESIEFQIHLYEHIQTFEGQKERPADGHRASRIIQVASDPDNSKMTDQEFDDWYRLQHLDMLHMTRGHRRTTRYQLIPPNDDTVIGSEDFDSIPRFTALYEYDVGSDGLDWEAMKQTKSTEWSKRIVAGYRVFHADEWRLIKEGGDPKAQLGVY